MRVLSLLAVAWLSLACSRAGFAPAEPDVRADARADLAPDLRLDGPVDAADSAPPDAWPDGGTCAVGPDPGTLALYPVLLASGTQLVDTTTDHPGKLAGVVPRVSGATGCGQALAFSGKIEDYAEIAADPAWNLKTGSIDLWVRIDGSTNKHLGIVSRDAEDTAKPGHFSLFQLVDGGIGVRLQRDSNDGIARCSQPVSKGDWHYIGVNFGKGGLELYVDGVPANRTDKYVVSPVTLKCGTSTEEGIDGNQNPWVLGASSHLSAEGVATPITYPFKGAIDSFRISNVRRDFGGGS
jgi:hypothetical protein